MNQILITEKLYVTPELRKKKKAYKVQFIISLILVLILASYYIYQEYDKYKNEKLSQEILANVDVDTNEDNTAMQNEGDVLVVILDDNEEPTNPEYANGNAAFNSEVQTTASGTKYSTIAIINIPKIGVNYPILSEASDELLKIAPNKFWGPNPNEVGNFCIVAHNYRNSKFFSKVPTLVNGDIVEITDLSGRTLKYSVYDKYTVDPEDVACTSQLTGGKKEITLITCTNDSKQRVIVKATEVL